MKVVVINGPNLNLLGSREPDVYGRDTLDEINDELREVASHNKIDIKFFQSNSEGELVTLIQNWASWADYLILNPAAYTHTSVAIRDAITSTGVRTIEVHLSNIYSREEFRSKSLVSGVVLGVISGFGKNSYKLALNAVMNRVK